MINIEVALIPFFAEIIVGEKSDKVLELQFSALRKLQSQLHYYAERGFHEKLIYAIAEKKGEMIIHATTKSEMERIMQAKAPHYDGGKFIPGENSIPEEELICWSETSLKGPLIPAAMKRYMELFRQCFPEEAQIVLGPIDYSE